MTKTALRAVPPAGLEEPGPLLEGLSLEQLLKIKERVDALVEVRRADAVEALRKQLAEESRRLGVSPKTLLGPLRRKPKRGGFYRGPDGEIWGGRGPTPMWLQAQIVRGRSREEFWVDEQRSD